MRYVEFTGCGQQISNSDFAEIETRLSIPLPVGLKEHYQKYNGGVPERQCWEYLDGEYYQVTDFIPFKYPINPETDDPNVSTYDTIEGTYERHGSSGVLDKAYLPFAYDLGGNYFCVQLTTNAVVYYAMDTDVDPIRPLTSSFQQFVDGLIECEEL